MTYFINKKNIAMRRVENYWYVRHTPSKNTLLLQNQSAQLWNWIINRPNEIDVFYNQFEDAATVESYSEIFCQELMRQGFLICEPESKHRTTPTPLLDLEKTSNKFDETAEKINQISLNNQKILLTEIELTHACNFRCLHCYQPDSWKMKKLTKNFRDWDEALLKLEQLGVMFVIFSGGECTLLPYFKKLVASARERFFDVSIITNGFYLTDNLLNFLTEQNISKITVSIYGDSEEEYRRFTQISGAFEKVISNVLKAKKLNLPVVARIICTKYQDNFSQTINFFQLHGVETEIIYEMMKKTEDDGLPTDQMSLSTLEVQTALNKTDTISQLPPKRSCTAGTLKIRIEPDGSIIPCELLRIKMANIFDDNLDDLLEKPLFKSTRDYVRAFNSSGNYGCPVMKGMIQASIFAQHVSS